MNTSLLIFVGSFIFVGIIFIAIGVVNIKKRKRRRAVCTVETPGKVVDILSEYHRSAEDGGIYYYPVFEYYIKGNAIIHKGHTGSRPCEYQKGQEVIIIFNPDKPSEFRVAGEEELGIIFSIVLIILGICFCFIAIIFWLLFY